MTRIEGTVERVCRSVVWAVPMFAGPLLPRHLGRHQAEEIGVVPPSCRMSSTAENPTRFRLSSVRCKRFG